MSQIERSPERQAEWDAETLWLLANPVPDGLLDRSRRAKGLPPSPLHETKPVDWTDE